MSWEWIAALTGGPAGTAVLGWVFRRRLRAAGTSSWVARRLNAEGALARCREDGRDMEASFARQEAALLREIAARDREIGYLMAAIERLNRSATEVLSARSEGLLTTSGSSPNAPSPSPAPSPSSPPKPPPTTVP